MRKIKIEEKTRQNTENKQTFDLTEKIEIDGKTRQNAENKQTFGIFLIYFPNHFYILEFHIPLIPQKLGKHKNLLF